MTSITHAAASSSSARILPARRAHAAPRFGADSKALRMGLGVAIAAVMAGDVYAVLRSPVSEGTASGRRGGASAAAAESVGASAGADGGYVATNPFGEAAYAASLASRSSAPLAAAGSGAAAAVPAVAAPAAPVLTAPAVSAPSLSPTLAPVGSFVPPVGGPSNPNGPHDNENAETPAEPGLLDPVVALVPQAEPVATIVEDVVADLPAPVAESLPAAPAGAASIVPVPVVAPAVPGGLSL